MRHEQGRKRHVDRAAIGVEDVSGRHHEADHGFGTSEALQLFHQAGERGVRGGRAKNDQDFLPDISQKFENVEPGPPGDDAEDSEDEDGAGQIECADQLRERPERADAESADGESHGSERAQGRGAHDDADDAEQCLRGDLDDVELARSQEYALLSFLLARAPDQALLERLAGLRGGDEPGAFFDGGGCALVRATPRWSG